MPVSSQTSRLLAIYARCVDGQLSDLKKRLEAAGDLEDLSGAD
ncbi:hypothetical protein [Streptomyces sp. NBC_00009]